MQMLCRLFLTLLTAPTGAGACLRPALAALLLWAGTAQAAPANAPAPPIAPSQLAAQGKAGARPGEAATAGSPTDKLFAQARQWVAQTQSLAPTNIEFAPLDIRLRVQDCPQPLTVDYPFNAKDTIRVRCTIEPAWQIYLSLVPPKTAPAGAAAGPSGASASSAPQAAPANASRTTVVTRRLLQRGTVLEVDMLEEVTRPALGLDPLAVTSLKDVQQAELVRDVPAGVALRSYDIKRAILVKKGQMALLTVGQGAGFQISVRVEAQQDGTLGEQIRLKNAESGRFLTGVVTGPNALKGL